MYLRISSRDLTSLSKAAKLSTQSIVNVERHVMWTCTPQRNFREKLVWVLDKWLGNTCPRFTNLVHSSRYIHQLQTSWNVDLWQGLSLYYTTVGFYLNHLMLYVSVWFALVSQLFLIFAQVSGGVNGYLYVSENCIRR